MKNSIGFLDVSPFFCKIIYGNYGLSISLGIKFINKDDLLFKKKVYDVISLGNPDSKTRSFARSLNRLGVLDLSDLDPKDAKALSERLKDRHKDINNVKEHLMSALVSGFTNKRKRDGKYCADVEFTSPCGYPIVFNHIIIAGYSSVCKTEWNKEDDEFEKEKDYPKNDNISY